MLLAKSNILLFTAAQALLMLCSVNGNAQYLLINEIMSSNFSVISDEDGDYEDWIELYNDTDTIINLEGYYISDDFNNLQRWAFPEFILEPGEFLLIFASGKDRTEGDNLHTNFSISKDGEPLILSNPEGEIIDYIAPVYIPTDYSYGRSPDASFIFKFFKEPTPGNTNVGETFSEVLSPVQFSHRGGFYTDEFTLQLSHPDPDVTIVYTLDGSEPDISNIDGTAYLYKNEYPFDPEDDFGDFLENKYYSHIYEKPIEINNRKNELDKLTQISTTVNEPDYFPESPVFKGTVVRAKPVKENSISDFVNTHTYFITPEGREKFPIPVISLSVQEDALFDYYDGIYTAGEDADKWREENPGEDFIWPFRGNFFRRGVCHEHPANFEYFEANKSQNVVNQQVGIRIQGGATRSFPMKSLRLYARSKYGNSEFNYQFFNNNSPAYYKRLILRNSGNDFPTDIWEPHLTSRTLFRDAAIQEIVKDLEFDTQAYQPTVLFINGEFWGIHNIRERYDKHYLNRVHGVDPDNIDLLTEENIVKEGDNNHYKKTIDYIEEHGLEFDAHYQHILTKIDIDNFIDYQIAQIFINNTDWPWGNIDFWRKRTDGFVPNASYGHDGKWRWMMYDTDFGFGLVWSYKYNSLEYATGMGNLTNSNPAWSTFLLRSFLQNTTFKQDFIDRFEYHLLSTFNPERVTNIIDSIAEMIEPVIPYHSNRWNCGELSLSKWQENIDVMREFAVKRPCAMKNMLIDFFDIKDDYYAYGVCPDDKINYVSLVQLYPNPAHERIFLEFPEERMSFTELIIRDYTGRAISNFDVNVFRESAEVDISKLEHGIYTICIVINEQYFFKKFVKL